MDVDALTLFVRVCSEEAVHPDLPFNGGYSEWFVTLVGLDVDASTSAAGSVTLGSAQVVLCRDARWNGRFWDRLDEASQDMEVIGSALSADHGAADDDLFGDDDLIAGDVLIIDRVSIKEFARGHQLSHVLVDAAARAIAPGAVLALLPMPAGEQNERTIGALQVHWERGGFAHYRDGVYVKRSEPLFV